MTRRPSVRTAATPPGGLLRRTPPSVRDERLEAYQARGKYAEPTVCTDCGAVFRRGRWAHGAALRDAKANRCPACWRIREGLPAGRILMEGPFFAAHRDEILRLVRHEAQNERSRHPISRIMDVENARERTRVTRPTSIPRVALAPRSSVLRQGELDTEYGDEAYTIRADLAPMKDP
jgi:hypothetical protein